MARGSTSMWFAGALAIALASVLLVRAAGPAVAQSGWWPWASEPIPGTRPPPVRREPAPTWRPPAPEYDRRQSQPGERSAVCLQLEQRLVDDQQRGSQSREALPRLENELREIDRAIRSGESQLERADCYDYFLFAKTLRRTRRCVGLADTLDDNRRRAAALDAQRSQILGSRERSYQDELIRELARNGCGPQYSQEARRRGNSSPFASLWQDEDTGPAGQGNDFRGLPFATYRTVCVRLCDGYFFPVSFSTLENHFGRDAETCQSKCAAPVDLYFYQNPGGSMDQAVSVTDRQPYTSLKTAFRYRNEFVQGCSCKQSEYTPSPSDQGGRRTEAPPAGRQAARPQ